MLWVDGVLVANQAFRFDPVTPRAPVNLVTSGLVPGGFVEHNIGFRAAFGDKPIGQLPPVR